MTLLSHSYSGADETQVLSAQVTLLPPRGTAGNTPAALVWDVYPPRCGVRG